MLLLLQKYLSKFLLKENGLSFSNKKIRKGPTIIKQKHRNHKIHATKLVLAAIIIGIFVSIWFRFTITSFAKSLFKLHCWGGRHKPFLLCPELTRVIEK